MVKAPCLLLNVVQSVDDKAPLALAEAVGILRVITGVVVPVATVDVMSTPAEIIVNAATSVTVPTLQLLFAAKLNVVPLIVMVVTEFAGT